MTKPIVDPLIDGEPYLGLTVNSLTFTRTNPSNPETYEVFSDTNEIIAGVSLSGQTLTVTVPNGTTHDVIYEVFG